MENGRVAGDSRSMTGASNRRVFVATGLCVSALLALAAISAFAQGRAGRTLNIYVVDVEGGNATLFVSPSGESMLIDTGNGGAAAPTRRRPHHGRGAGRGVTRIDHLVMTHWHGDHVGGLADSRPAFRSGTSSITVRTCSPRRASTSSSKTRTPSSTRREPTPSPNPATRCCRRSRRAHRQLRRSGPLDAASRRREAESLLRDVQADREQRRGRAVRGHARPVRPFPPSRRPANRERVRADVPERRIDAVDVLLGLHHGQDTSNSDVLVHAVRPRVAIVNNGTRKGGWPVVMKTLFHRLASKTSGRSTFRCWAARSTRSRACSLRTALTISPPQCRLRPRRCRPGPCCATSGPRRSGVLDQGRRASRWRVHGDKREKWLFEDL